MKETGTALLQKPVYGLIDVNIFGLRIVSGIVTGVRFTEADPVYEISFGKNSWWTTVVTQDINEIPALLGLASLERVKETHGLKIRWS